MVSWFLLYWRVTIRRQEKSAWSPFGFVGDYWRESMKTIRFIAILSPALWLVTAAAAQEFSADQVVHDPTGRILKSKMYMSHGKVRIEDRDDTTGKNPNAWDASITIADLARGVVYQLIPNKKVYIEQSGAMVRRKLTEFQISGDPCAIQVQSSTAAAAHPVPGQDGPKCAKLGSEVINGRTTDKWEITAKLGGQVFNGHVWIDTHFHVPMKSEAEGAESELQNLREGPQPDGLFEIPADYRKMDMRDMLRGGSR
jgi:hypothetical protein